MPSHKPNSGSWTKGNAPPQAWKRGQSGNPGGRAKIPEELKTLARGYSVEAIETLAKIMRSPKAGASARSMAAQALLDRGWGRPAQQIEANVNIIEQLTIEDQRALTLALAALADSEEGAPGGAGETHH